MPAAWRPLHFHEKRAVPRGPKRYHEVKRERANEKHMPSRGAARGTGLALDSTGDTAKILKTYKTHYTLTLLGTSHGMELQRSAPFRRRDSLTTYDLSVTFQGFRLGAAAGGLDDLLDYKIRINDLLITSSTYPKSYR